LAPSGIGIDEAAQVGLFHLAAMAVFTPPMTADPTAVQFAVELQPTAPRSLDGQSCCTFSEDTVQITAGAVLDSRRLAEYDWPGKRLSPRTASIPP
jgi:hypothetical protein